MAEKTYVSANVLHGRCETVPVTLQNVQFHGIDRTKHDALVKEIAHLFKSTTLDQLIHDCGLAVKHMKEVELLQNATALLDTCSDTPNGYKVDFYVKEPGSFSLGAKAGVTSKGDADFTFHGGSQSFGGRGETFATSYSHTYKGDHTFNFSLSKPYLGWQKYSNVSLAAFRSLAHLPWNHSESKENGIYLQYSGQLWARKLFHTIRLNMIWRKFFPLINTAFPVREHAGHTLKFSLENSIAYDTRNNRLLPSKGLLLQLTQEYAGLLGDAAFVKHQLNFQAAAPIVMGIFLSASLQASLLTSLGDRSLHVMDRIYLGGSHDIRGFALNSIGPRLGSTSLGGASSYMAILHAYRPLVPSDMFFAHAFIASGVIGTARSRQRFSDLINSSRISAGLGLAVVFRNIFRLELNYVIPLRYEDGDIFTPGFQLGAGVNFY